MGLMLSKRKGHPFWVPNGKSSISNLRFLRLSFVTLWWRS